MKSICLVLGSFLFKSLKIAEGIASNGIAGQRPNPLRGLLAAGLAVLLLSALPAARVQGRGPQIAPQAAGDLDTTFGVGGTVTTDFSDAGFYSCYGYALASDAAGKMLSAGYAYTLDGRSAIALARYNIDGSLDSGFGTGGKVTTDFFGHLQSASAIAVQGDGKIVTVGFASHSNDRTSNDFAMARFNIDGSFDSTFGSAGKVTTDFFGSYDYPTSVASQPDGAILLGGYSYLTSDSSNGPEAFALARYNSDGSLDSSFGSGGKVTTQIAGFTQSEA